MEILALLPLVWLLVWLMQSPKADTDRDRYVKIILNNMKDEISGYNVVSASKNLRTGDYYASLWLPSIHKATTLKASSKEKLEELVIKTREELINPE